MVLLTQRDENMRKIIFYQFLYKGVAGTILAYAGVIGMDAILRKLRHDPASVTHVCRSYSYIYLWECFLRALEKSDWVVLSMLGDVDMPPRCVFRALMAGSTLLLRDPVVFPKKDYTAICNASPGDQASKLRQSLYLIYSRRILKLQFGVEQFCVYNFYDPVEDTLEELRDKLAAAGWTFHLDANQLRGERKRNYHSAEYPRIEDLLSFQIPTRNFFPSNR